MAEEELCTRLSQLHLVTKAATGLTKAPANTDYILQLDAQSCAECGAGAALVAASCSDNTVRLYSRQSLAYSHTIKGHEETITGVKFCRSDPNILYTSSRDQSIRRWDIRMKGSKAASVFEGYEDTHNMFTSFDVSCNGQVICAGTEQKSEQVHLIFWDARNSNKLGVYSECHQDDIVQVSFHPSKADWLLTGSMDQLVCLFDIGESDEEDALLATFNCNSPVSQIGWCGEKCNNVYGLTYISTMHIWDTSEFDPVLEVTDLVSDQGEGSIDYLVDCFQVTEDQMYLVAGSFKEDTGMSVLKVTGDGVRPHVDQLKGHDDVVRCLHWDHQTKSLVTGGEDSMLCMWTTDQPETGRDKPNLKAKSRKSLHREQQQHVSRAKHRRSHHDTSVDS